MIIEKIGRSVPKTSTADRLIRQVASWCLSYPDQEVSDRLPQLTAAMTELAPGTGRDALLRFLDTWSSTPAAQRRRTYVELFDLDRHLALHLSYWTDGDTRRRGQALADFKQQYRLSGFRLTDDQELPDHLTIVLEFAAIVDPQAGTRLLQQYRPSLELIRLALADRGSPFADVLVAVCSTLPGQSPKDRAGVQELAGPPPVEAVGLEGYR
ncbi:nitrate reductase molybdenum cofactor assembly chaperone [Microlunatus soli]|uniref:Respiratory nitrate reductase chaperone NarJ n=1 Tax=Microlunatus soli TaxID=630515 RepID=A0A1H2AE87_9ACTN|nr:nitrate reductase molybdenum cofactor assembly chaperone [Microlunatus soli]SDT44187.1 respiratory nitrate reductase chaperone NarJ [Microlunatus soli]